MNTLITDIDLTVLDFNTPWEQFVRNSGVEIPHEGFLQGYHRLTDALGMHEDQETELLNNFFHSEHFYTLPEIHGAANALQKLHERGWEFIAVSACPTHEGVVEGRRRNLETVLKVPFREVHVTGVGGCKKEVLSRFDPAVWVEDNFHNAVVGHDMGHRTFLMNQSHNYHFDAPMSRVDHWDEIIEALCTGN